MIPEIETKKIKKLKDSKKDFDKDAQGYLSTETFRKYKIKTEKPKDKSLI